MDIQWLSDMGKRALAQISAAVCGEELTRITMPAVHEFLDGSSPLSEPAELRTGDPVKA